MSDRTDLAIPILPCRSVSATTTFYRSLGFEGGPNGFDPNYAIFKRGDIELHFFTHAELVRVGKRKRIPGCSLSRQR